MRVHTYSSIVLGKLCIPAVNDSKGEGFIHIQDFIFSHLSCGAAKLKLVEMIAVRGCCNMTQVSVVAPLANPMLGIFILFYFIIFMPLLLSIRADPYVRHYILSLLASSDLSALLYSIFALASAPKHEVGLPS